MVTKWSKALVLLLHKEKLGLLEGLVLDVLEEWLRTALPNVKQTQVINQQNATSMWLKRYRILRFRGYFCGFF
jgi:hypothetical protein